MLFILLNNFFVIVVVAMVRGKVMSKKAASKEEKILKDHKIINGGTIFDQVGTRSKVVLPLVVGALYDTRPKRGNC